MTLAFDWLFFFAGWVAGQLIFQGYEAHAPPIKRLAKLSVLTLTFAAVRIILGRKFFYSLLGLMSAAMTVLHGYWFHHRHGIHWRTAEPREKYLQLIGK